MNNVTVEELEKIQKTVSDALAMHGKWLENLQRIFACRLSPEESDLARDAHQRCDFGRWFYSKPNSKLREIPAFKQIEVMHSSMHNTVREVCGKLRAVGQIQPDDYDVLLSQVKQFSGALKELSNKVDYTLRNIDSLTGAINNTRLLPNLKDEQKKLRKNGHPYGLLLVNVDVKHINYEFSREMGDQVLRSSVATIKDELDANDRVYRYGGAEFVVTLPEKNQQQAERIKDQLLKRIGEAASTVLNQPKGALNIHYGIAMLDPTAYIEQLIDQCARSTYIFDFNENSPTGDS